MKSKVGTTTERFVVKFNGKYLVSLGENNWDRNSWTEDITDAHLFNLEKDHDLVDIENIKAGLPNWKIEEVNIRKVYSAEYSKKRNAYVIVQDGYKSGTIIPIRSGDYYKNGDYETEALTPEEVREHLKVKLNREVNKLERELDEAKRLLYSVDSVEVIEDKDTYDISCEDWSDEDEEEDDE